MSGHRESSGWRWLNIALRTTHLAGVVDVALGILGQGAPHVTGVVLMLATGFAMYGIDLRRRPGLWREVAGMFVVAKLALVVAMVLAPQFAALLFWIVLVSSSIVSHAPHGFRHRRIIG